MSPERKDAEPETRIGWNPSTVMSEEALDEAIEDSFPASDPPSHTPTTSLGAPQGRESEGSGGRRPNRTLAMAGGAAMGILIITGLVVSALWRHHTNSAEGKG